jgi:hypothetical protein
MADWVTEYLGLKPKRDSEPSAPARTDLSRVVPTLEPVTTSRPPAPESRSTLSSDLENLSIGLGRGLTSQLEGVKTLVTQPREVLEGMAQFAGEVVDDPRILAEMAKEYGIKATSSPMGFGEVVGEMLSPVRGGKVPKAEIMKPPGGNWLPGTVEKFVDRIRDEFVQVRERPVERLRRLEGVIAGARDPGNANLEAHEGMFAREKARLEAQIPVDRWLEKKLTNYIKNDAATERDPVRLGIEQRVAKVEADKAKADQRIAKQQAKIAEAKAAGRDTTAIEDRLALEMADLEQKYELDRRAAGIPTISRDMRSIAVSNRTSNLFPEARPYATTPQSQDWEDMMDYMVEPHTAAGLWANRFRRGENLVGEAPWLAKVPPETPVYELFGDSEYFKHLRDELYNSVRIGSDIPLELRLGADDLEKMNMDAAVAHVGKVDSWRERNRVAANLARSNNPAVFTVKEYPGTGLEWKQLKMPEAPKEWSVPERYEIKRPTPSSESLAILDRETGKYITTGLQSEEQAIKHLHQTINRDSLEKALEYEGSVMGHCVGGYCPQVASGKTQIFSLRDAKGEPHVTIEVRPNDVAGAVGRLPAEERGALAMEIRDKYFGGVTPVAGPDENKFFELIDQAYVEKYGEPPSDIVQIKGKGNKKPADKYIPFVQDFVRSSNFGQIGDFYNTNLVKVTPGQRLPGLTKEIPPGLYTNAELKQMAVDSGMPKEILDNWMQKLDEESIFKYADGGRVEEEKYDEAEIERIVAPLRAKLEGYLGEAKKLPRKAKQAVADVTEIGDIIKRSKEIPLTYYDPKGEVAGEADAMRHLLFQAQLQQKYGELPAKAVSYIHEYSSFGQPSAEREMDFLNDELGREIGRSAKSDRELVEMARKYIESGRAKTLPKEQRGGY